MSSTEQAQITNLPAEWVDEIATTPSAFKSLVVSVASLMLFGLGWACWDWGPGILQAFLDENVPIAIHFESGNQVQNLNFCFQAFGVVGALCALAGLLSLYRHAITYHLLRASLIGVYLAVAVYVVTVWIGLFDILDAELKIYDEEQDRATILLRWWSLCWPALAVAFYAGWLRLMLRSRSVYAAFTSKAGDAMSGDRVLEDIRTHGRDPHHRRSMYASVFTHIMVLIIIPWLLGLFEGGVEAYKVPKGSGTPAVAVVQMSKKKKKKQKTLTLRPNSNIITDIPDLDETEADKEMEQQSEAEYVAGEVANPGKLGKGGGDKGGWPEGSEDYKVRFIRLEHSGAGWDDGMVEGAADSNFLRFIAKSTPFKRVARKGESHSIALLRKYPKDGFPPFVYLTGNGNMGRVSKNDQKILRDYCMGGGMLIADAGSPQFHRSFLNFMRQVFEDKPLIDIADDDMIFQAPYRFPNGAPGIFAHGGSRALGVKHDGRWIVFYHPGDMNDAWKSEGYFDGDPEVKDAALRLGINIMSHAFNSWDDAVSKARK